MTIRPPSGAARLRTNHGQVVGLDQYVLETDKSKKFGARDQSSKSRPGGWRLRGFRVRTLLAYSTPLKSANAKASSRVGSQRLPGELAFTSPSLMARRSGASTLSGSGFSFSLGPGVEERPAPIRAVGSHRHSDLKLRGATQLYCVNYRPRGCSAELRVQNCGNTELPASRALSEDSALRFV